MRRLNELLPASCIAMELAIDTQVAREASAAGRSLARHALASLGSSEAASIIGRDPRGAPLWPPNCVGSISHTKKRVIVAVAHAQDYSSLGIDVEEDGRALPLRLAQRIATDSERAWITDCDDEVLESARLRLLALASAKESIFKALWPLHHVEVGFADARLIRVPAGFSATITNDKVVTGNSEHATLEITLRRSRSALYTATWIRAPQIP